MIIILSVDTDYSTSQVIRWLNYYKKPFIRINQGDEVVLESLNHKDLKFSFQGKSYCFSEITAVWYRRGNFNINILPFDLKGPMLEGYNKEETAQITSYIHNLFKLKKSINNFNVDVNKLDILRYCNLNGLNDAEFLVTQSKEELQDFFYKHQREIISKPANNPYVLLTDEKAFSTYTYLVKEEDIAGLPEFFTPTFFQQQIKKKYEIRTFYLEGEFFSMAIFSQSNSQTEVDFRQYDWNKPNRVTPFCLPQWYRNKMTTMLGHFNINCASLDTIITHDNNYYMLDVNPIGQFGMTSRPCNYNLEMKIATYLL